MISVLFQCRFSAFFMLALHGAATGAMSAQAMSPRAADVYEALFRVDAAEIDASGASVH